MVLSKQLVEFVHLFIIAPALSAIGIAKNHIPHYAYPFIAVAGVVVAVLHIALAVENKWPSNLLNWLRAFSFAPLMIYIGVRGKDASKLAFDCASVAAPFAVILNVLTRDIDN